MAQAPAPAAKTTAPAAPKNGAKPGTEDKKAAKVKKVAFTSTDETVMKDGKLLVIPTDHDAKVHLPIKRKGFADEGMFYELRARQMEAKAADYRKMAADSAKLGGVKDKAKAKQLLKMQDKIAELTKTLAAAGIDVAALLGTKKEDATPALG